MADVVVVGSYNHDYVWRSTQLPTAGETRLGSFTSGPGGKGFNQAIAAARQGARCAFIGALGEDAAGQAALALAASEGVNAVIESKPDLATGSAAILLDAAGQNMIVVGPGANAALSAAHIRRHAGLMTKAKVLVVQNETSLAACAEAMQIAREAGVLTMYNPAPAADSMALALLPLTDVLTPNESEFVALLKQAGVKVDDHAIDGHGDEDLHALCRRLGVPTVVLTLGARGAFVSHAASNLRGDSINHYRHAAEPATVLDTTGAGDAFNGGLAAALARAPQAPFAKAVRDAGRVAALAVERAGAALAMPLHREVLARFTD
ncbi:MAG: ribokinase [Pseudomarimonas sp.]